MVASSGYVPVRNMKKIIFQFLKGLLTSQNQFASGGLLLIIVGAIGVYLRSLPMRLCSWLIYQTTMVLTVTDDDTAFDWIKEWFLEQKFLKRVRWLDLDTSLRGEEAALIPAPGKHRFWYCGRPFWVWFSRKDDTQGWTPRRLESLIFEPWDAIRNSSRNLFERWSRATSARSGWLPTSTSTTRRGGTYARTPRACSIR